MEGDSEERRLGSSDELSSAEVTPPAKKSLPIPNGPETILHEQSQISAEDITDNGEKVSAHSHGNGTRTEGSEGDQGDTSAADSTSPPVRSSLGTGTLNGSDNTQRSMQTELEAHSLVTETCGKYGTEKEEARQESGEEAARNSIQTSFINELALSNTGISSEKDRAERDCDSNKDKVHGIGREDDSRLDDECNGKSRGVGENSLEQRACDRGLDQTGSEDKADKSVSSAVIDQREIVRNSQRPNTDGASYGKQGGSSDYLKADRDALEASRDGLGDNVSAKEEQVLDQVESICDRDGQDREHGNEDRALEQFSEILLDSDLSDSEEEGAELEVCVEEDGNSHSAEASAEPKKKAKKVRFADEVPGSNGM